MNDITVLRERINALIAPYGVEVHDLSGVPADHPDFAWEITLPFEHPSWGRTDLFLGGMDELWSVDPYFVKDAGYTPEQARSIASSILEAAQLVDALNAMQEGKDYAEANSYLSATATMLREEQTRQKLSLEDLANKAEMNPAILRRKLQQPGMFRFSEIHAVLRALQIPVEKMFTTA
jgi:hypothetical protein